MANACVQSGEAASSGAGPTEPSSGVEPPDPDDGVLEGSTATPPPGGSTTVAVGEDTSSGPGPTTGVGEDDTTTGEMEVDPFDGTELSATWSSFAQPGTELWVADGQLRVSVGPSPDAWTVAGAVMDVDTLVGGWERVLVTEPDDSGLRSPAAWCSATSCASSSSISRRTASWRRCGTTTRS